MSLNFQTPDANSNSGTGSIRTRILQRDQLIKRLLEMKTNINDLNNMSPYQLEVKCSLLERQLEFFERIQGDLESLDESQFSNNHRDVFEQVYCEIKAVILERISGHGFNVSEGALSSTRMIHQPLTSYNLSSTSRHPHLPTLQLPKFSGNYKDWLEFYSMFCMLVHDNAELSAISKFQYLRSCLTDGAERLIQSLEVIPDNYEAALDLLKGRYDNKKQLFHTHLLDIFEVQNLNHPNASSLRLFIDNINASLRALHSFASTTQISNGIILHLVVSKLDAESQAKWEDDVHMYIDDSDPNKPTFSVPSWDDLASFLERRCKTLELYESNNMPPHDHQLHNHSHPNQKSKKNTTAFVSTDQQSKCKFCNSSVVHNPFGCTQFRGMSVQDRYKTVKSLKLCLNCLGTNHIASSCPSNNTCQECGANHHTLLHKQPISTSTSASETTTTDLATDDQNSTTALQSSQINSPVILATAIVELSTAKGIKVVIRALLDSCSQSNFISERIANQLRVERKKINTTVCGIGGTDVVCAKYSCTVNAKSQTSGFAPTFDAIIIPSITSSHPKRFINISSWNIPQNIKLADTSFNIPGPIDLLVGVDLFWNLLMVGKIKTKNQPNFIKTKLGWIVAGTAGEERFHSQQQKSTTTLLIKDKTQSPVYKYNPATLYSNEPLLDKLLESFWKIEHIDMNNKPPLSAEETECERFFQETTTRCKHTNKFIVRLPFKINPQGLGQSYQIVQRRFSYLESRFVREKCIQKEYNEFIKEYIKLNHMSLVQPHEAEYYIPHHCVIKPDSSTTRLRVVFDASCATTNGKSLNDILMVGPTLQDDVFTILSRFRYHKFVLVADIAKMYRQVLVHEADRKWQCIFWRNCQNDPLKSYQLNTVTYGTSSAPYLAVKCLQHLAFEDGSYYPTGAKVINQDLYVDNLMTGGSTIEEVLHIKQQVSDLLQRGGFPLRKFASNCEYILVDVPESEREVVVEVDNMQYVKTLGLKWSPTEDVFSFSYPQQQRIAKTTKRSILAHTASFFDPMGFINPVIVKCKVLMQELWKLKLHWDESVPQDIFCEWRRIRDDLNSIGQHKIPRFVIFDKHTKVHVFVDASTKAYGACVYAVNGRESKLLCAKSRIAPIKEISLPRLELCAATLGGELLKRIRHTFPCQPSEINCWSDSTITLSWIAADPSRWPTFIANRVVKIKRFTDGCVWRHVPSELNPADLLSRGTTVSDLNRELWFAGPQFLKEEPKKWPNQQLLEVNSLVNESQTTLICNHTEDFISGHKYANNYEKFLRIISYVKRYIALQTKNKLCHGPIGVPESSQALLSVCYTIQNSSFNTELKSLSCNKPLPRQSKLQQLSPFLHNGLIRVGGRLKNSSLSFATKHPIVLPGHHPFVRTMIRHFHIKHLHAGALTLHNILRDQFWIINAKNVIKKVIHQCVLCYRCRPVTESQVMGSLPSHRVEQSFPFSISGVDYCGPFYITSKIRGRPFSKSYIAIFICFSVKAVHLELVPELTSAAFISALKRFISRRGHCSVIYSDNATNFIGANRELREMLKTFLSEAHNNVVSEACRQEGIIWKFIPPRSPHFGGLWESAVKQAKHYIRRTMGSHVLTHDELHTVCCQTEAIINSRPLTQMSPDPNDLRPLTPAHFLVGRPLTTVPEPSLQHLNPASLKGYQAVEWIQQQFWDRWRNEYLKLLQQRTKWTATNQNLQVNDLVMLKEENIPPLKWPLARVTECTPGDDGIVRVVTVKTADGSFKRAITKLCKLPVDV